MVSSTGTINSLWLPYLVHKLHVIAVNTLWTVGRYHDEPKVQSMSLFCRSSYSPKFWIDHSITVWSIPLRMEFLFVFRSNLALRMILDESCTVIPNKTSLCRYVSVDRTDADLNYKLWHRCGLKDLFSMPVIFEHELYCLRLHDTWGIATLIWQVLWLGVILH